MAEQHHSILPPGFTAHPIAEADREAAISLLRDYALASFGYPMLVGYLRYLLEMPGFDPANSTMLVLAPGGHPVGVAWVSDIASPPVHPDVTVAVLPTLDEPAVGRYLLQWSEERARQAVARVPEGLRVSMFAFVSSTYEPTRQLLQEAGWQPIRYYFLMAVELEEKPPEPNWPAGIVVQTYLDRPDLRTVYRTVHEAFRDHWGYVEHPEEEGLAHWQHSMSSSPSFDPSLWFLAMAGEEMAGVSLCMKSFAGDAKTGYVDELAVRRPWRRRGLGLALLYHSFGEYYRRGYERVALEVDAGSLTGATRLYERAGMHVDRERIQYEKELRPGKELGREEESDDKRSNSSPDH